MIWPPSNPISIRMRSVATDKLREYPVGRIRVQEGDLEPEKAAARAGVHELHAVRREPVELGGYVLDLVGHVVHPGAAAGEEPPDGGVRTEGGEQLHAAFADEHGR